MEEMLLSASKLQKESNKTKLTCPGLKRTLMPDLKIGQNKLYNYDEKNTSKQSFLYLKQLNNINYVQKVK